MNVARKGLRTGAVAVVVLAAALAGLSPADAAVRSGPRPALASPASVPASASAVMVTSPRVSGLRLRSRGSFSGYVRGQLYRGDRVRVVGWQGPWVEVQLVRRSAGGLRAGTLGWSYRPYVYRPRVCGSAYICKHW